MPALIDVTADLPPAQGLSPVRELCAAEVSTLAEELVSYQQHVAPLFQRREQRDWAALYLRGLLTADVPRKNVEAMALRLLGAGPHAERQVRALQQFVGEGQWDDEAILAEHQRLVKETLFDEEGVFIIDGSEFPKHGSHSVGVAPQWCGHTGKKDNCQAGVFLGYASRKGATFLDRRLYLPEAWFDEDHQPMWRACRIPAALSFQTRHDLAAELVEKIMSSQRLTAQWVVCDEGYGDSPAFLERLAGAGLWYLAEVPRTPRSGPCSNPMGRRHGSAPAAGSHRRPAHAKALLPNASDCIPPAQAKSRWRIWPKGGPLPPGSGFGCLRGTKARWSPISSCCAPCCRVIACQAQRSGW